ERHDIAKARRRPAIATLRLHESPQTQSFEAKIKPIAARLAVAAILAIVCVPALIDAQLPRPVQPSHRGGPVDAQAGEKTRVEQDLEDARARERLQREIQDV